MQTWDCRNKEARKGYMETARLIFFQREEKNRGAPYMKSFLWKLDLTTRKNAQEQRDEGTKRKHEELEAEEVPQEQVDLEDQQAGDSEPEDGIDLEEEEEEEEEEPSSEKSLSGFVVSDEEEEEEEE